MLKYSNRDRLDITFRGINLRSVQFRKSNTLESLNCIISFGNRIILEFAKLRTCSLFKSPITAMSWAMNPFRHNVRRFERKQSDEGDGVRDASDKSKTLSCVVSWKKASGIS